MLDSTFQHKRISGELADETLEQDRVERKRWAFGRRTMWKSPNEAERDANSDTCRIVSFQGSGFLSTTTSQEKQPPFFGVIHFKRKTGNEEKIPRIVGIDTLSAANSPPLSERRGRTSGPSWRASTPPVRQRGRRVTRSSGAGG